MRKTARILVTIKCNRSCPGCANDKFVVSDQANHMKSVEEIKGYDDVIVTGGEPMLRAKATETFIDMARNRIAEDGKIFMYSSTVEVGKKEHTDVLKKLDGITFTVHYESKLKDILMMMALGGWIEVYKKLYNPNFTARLLLDTRLVEKFELANLNHSAWNEIKWLEWIEDGECPLPEHETGYIYQIF